MDIFLQIVLQVILPVFTLIIVGALFHRKFKLDLSTLSKLNTFLLLPVVGFVNMFSSHFDGAVLLMIVGFLILQNAALMLFSSGIAKLAKFEPRLAGTFKNSVVLNNSGNFGLPISQLVFTTNPFGQSIQVVVMIFQNLITFTYGMMNSISGQAQTRLYAIKEFFRNPIIYAFLLGLLLNLFHIEIPSFIWTPIENIVAAFLAIALITLGAQSAYLKITHISKPLLFSLLGRLIVSPIIALLLIYLLGLEGTTAQALFIASAFPSSRNSALFALEYDNHPEYAAQAVILSTILSSITVAAVVYIARILFV